MQGRLCGSAIQLHTRSSYVPAQTAVLQVQIQHTNTNMYRTDVKTGAPYNTARESSSRWRGSHKCTKASVDPDIWCRLRPECVEYGVRPQSTQRDTRDCPAKGKTGHAKYEKTAPGDCGTAGVCMIPMLWTLCDPDIIQARISLVLSHILRGNSQSDVSWFRLGSYFLSHGRRRIPETRQTQTHPKDLYSE